MSSRLIRTEVIQAMDIKHGRIGMTRPESFPKLFDIYSYETETTDRGRNRLDTPVLKDNALCILSVAKPNEVERFKQLGVTVTHDIIQRGAAKAKENDIFVLMQNGAAKRYFRVKAVHDKGEMQIDTVYYCEERGDIKL